MANKASRPLDPAYIERLKTLQRESGLPQDRLAEMLDRSEGVVNRLINHGMGYDVATMAELAKVYGRPVSDLLPLGEVSGYYRAADVPLIDRRILPSIKAEKIKELILAWGGPTIMARTDRPHCFGIEVTDGEIDKRVPCGSVIIIDADDRDLSDGKIYLLISPDKELMLRVYRADGVARFEGDSISPPPPLFDVDSMLVLGRAVHSFSML